MRFLERGRRIGLLTAGIVIALAEAAGSLHLQQLDVSSSGTIRTPSVTNNNSTIKAQRNPFLELERFKELRDKERKGRKQRRRNAREFLQKLPQRPETAERVSAEEWKIIDEKQKKRGLTWFGGSGSSSAYSSSVLVDPSQYYDKWAQAYRMLGGYIDCDHDKSDDSHDSGDNNGGDGDGACARWMMWAAVSSVVYGSIDSMNGRELD